MEERDTIVRVQHGEFELEGVGRGDVEGDPVVSGVFGELNFEGL